MLMENKAINYIKYTIVEIVFVVFGTLIAVLWTIEILIKTIKGEKLHLKFL